MLNKKQQLKNFKTLATVLLLVMLLLFISSTLVLKYHANLEFFLLLKAFSEAALVGALADWFAVAALFSYPMGLKIPHTNIIASKKDKLGEQLGAFVLQNFFQSNTIKPYIRKIQVSKLAFQYLSVPANFSKIMMPIEQLLINELNKTNTLVLENWLIKQAKVSLEKIEYHWFITKQLHLFLENPNYLQIENNLMTTLNQLVVQNESLIKTKILENSYSFTPKFIDEKIANKVYLGILDFANEITQQEDHHFRQKCRKELKEWLMRIEQNQENSGKINTFVRKIVSENASSLISTALRSSKTYFLKELNQANSPLLNQIRKGLYSKIIQMLENDTYFVNLDKKIQSLVFVLFYKNKNNIAFHIEKTIKNWDAKLLSEKLENEIGKDLQYIRINGTLVGGCIGLMIYALEKIISY